MEEGQDFLEIWTGSMTTDNLLERFTGNIVGDDLSPLYSTNHLMLIKLISDGSNERHGFDASWTSGLFFI